jgi:hypothetical protein
LFGYIVFAGAGQDYGALADLLEGAIKMGKKIGPILRKVEDVAGPLIDSVMETLKSKDSSSDDDE